MLHRGVLVITDVSEDIIASTIGVKRTREFSDDGGHTFLRNIRSYKSHTASHPIRRFSSNFAEVARCSSEERCDCSESVVCITITHEAKHRLLCRSSCHHPPTYLPDLAPSYFSLFPTLKLDIKEAGFATMEDSRWFQHLVDRWSKCA
jgi:hypothetical protein